MQQRAGQQSRKARPLSTTLCLIVVLILGCVDAAWAQPAQASRDDVFAAIGVDQVPVDYVVLVDTSGSMQDSGLYGRVTTALQPFLAALKPQDHLSVITFDTAPALRFSGTVGPDGSVALKQLPARATGQDTDIGAATEAALGELERPDANALQSVVLITDGKHEPPRGSAYPDTTGPAWDTLTKRAGEVTARHKVGAFALALTQDADARLLKSVFPSTTVVALPSDQIGSFLDRVQQETRIARARELLAPDLGGGVQASITGDLDKLNLQAGGTTNATLSLHSTYQKIPVTVSDLAVATSGPMAATVQGLPASVDLAPGETKAIPLTITYPNAGTLPPQATTLTAPLSTSGTVTSPWQNVITKDLALSFEPKLTATPANLAGSLPAAPPLPPPPPPPPEPFNWTRAGLWTGLLAVMLLVMYSIWLSRQPKLHGSLSAYREGELVLDGRPLRGRKMALGKGGLKPLEGTIAGTLKAVRRADPYDEHATERGIKLNAQADGEKRHAELYASDSVSVGSFELTYEN